MADFIPHSDDSLNLWLDNFKAKLATHAATIGVTAADVTIYQNQCDTLMAAIASVNLARSNFNNIVSSKNEVRSDTISNIRSLAARIKTNVNYTEAIGNDLKIMGASSVFDAATAKPVLVASLNGGHVILNFKKMKSNGIKIYGRRTGEAAFSFLTLDTHSPYHDNRNNVTLGVPEMREYFAFYIDNNDEQFGLQSDIVSITV
ncbi:MAG: hypothetical protein ABUL44_04945 [Flavobacterium sp.]